MDGCMDEEEPGVEVALDLFKEGVYLYIHGWMDGWMDGYIQ